MNEKDRPNKNIFYNILTDKIQKKEVFRRE
jgi:hypothetical protein